MTDEVMIDHETPHNDLTGLFLSHRRVMKTPAGWMCIDCGAFHTGLHLKGPPWMQFAALESKRCVVTFETRCKICKELFSCAPGCRGRLSEIQGLIIREDPSPTEKK